MGWNQNTSRSLGGREPEARHGQRDDDSQDGEPEARSHVSSPKVGLQDAAMSCIHNYITCRLEFVVAVQGEVADERVSGPGGLRKARFRALAQILRTLLTVQRRRFAMAKERPPIECHSCGNMVAHLYLAERGGETIQVCSDCKAKGD